MNTSPTTAAQPDRWRRYGAFAAGVAERVHHSASYNPLSECTIQDPYPVSARLREHSPVHRSVILGSWILSRYDDVLSVARDQERYSNDPRWRNATASVLPPAPDDYSILLVNPPEHTRLRKVAARAFTRPRLMALEPTIEALANDIVDRAVKRAEVERMAEVAQPMAMRVMLRMLGIAGDEETRWHRPCGGRRSGRPARRLCVSCGNDLDRLRPGQRTVRLERVFRVVHRSHRATPLAAVPMPSRFGDPQARYAALYVAEFVRGAFWETLGCNRFAAVAATLVAGV